MELKSLCDSLNGRIKYLLNFVNFRRSFSVNIHRCS